MNREIKFRCWDKKEKEWMFGYETLGGFSLIGEIIMCGELSSIPLEYLTNMEFNQFTGLHDKNGVEIYEGDVLNGTWTQTDENGYKTVHDFKSFNVLYSDEHASFIIPCTYDKYIKNPIGNYLNFLHQINLKDSEVIGNIYENPELTNQRYE